MSPAEIARIYRGATLVQYTAIGTAAGLADGGGRPLFWLAFGLSIAMSLVRGFLKAKYNIQTLAVALHTMDGTFHMRGEHIGGVRR